MKSPVRTFQHATATITVCVLVAFCEGFDLQAAGVTARGIAVEFKLTLDQIGTFFSASTLGLFIGALVGGRLSDLFGRKRTLIVSILLFGIFSILTAAAYDFHRLCVARLLTGAGLGGVLPNIIALVNESSGARRRSANVALAYSGLSFGGAVVSLTSLLSAPAHWRLIFIAGGIAPLVFAPLVLLLVRESAEFGSVANSTGPTWAADYSAFAAESEANGFIAIFAGGRAIPTLLLWISFFLALLTLYLLLSWLPILLVANGLSNAEAAGVQIAFNVGGGMAALLIGQLLENKARNWSVTAAFVAAPVFVLLLSRTPPDVRLVVAIVFALGCSMAAVQGFLYATAPRCYPARIRGFGVGAAIAISRVGSVVGPKLGGMLKTAGHSSPQLLMDILPLVVLGSLAGLVLAWQTARRGDG
jgi:MFS transporter, AAHS family, 3-hydroxyphenylpropionic acid transporter